MQTHLTNYSHRRAWRTTCVVLGLLLVCYCSGIWAFIPPLRHATVNHITWTQGKTELLIGAASIPKLVRLSPDGRHLIISHAQGNDRRWYVWDLVTRERQYLDLPVRRVRWLTPTALAVTATVEPGFFVVDIPSLTLHPAPRYPDETYTQPGWQTTILNHWQAADQMYVLHTFNGAGYTIVTKEADSYHSYRGFANLPDATIEQQLLTKVDHTLVPKYARPIPQTTGQRIDSPDGRWYVQSEYGGMAAIRTQEGRTLARVYKAWWNARVLGWAHDGSGVYVQFAIDGAGNAVGQPAKPVYKLSPFTPVEAAWHFANQVLFGLIIVLGGIDLGVQARRQREANDN